MERKTLAEWRAHLELTQRDLATLVGCTHATINNIESGRSTTRSPTVRRIAAALDLGPDQILPGTPKHAPAPSLHAPNDGFEATAPRKPLRWWREKRALPRPHLAQLAQVTTATIEAIETNRHGSTKTSVKQRLAHALRVPPDRIIFPGEPAETPEEQNLNNVLRAELRGARRALRRAYDFIACEPNIASGAVGPDRDALLSDLEKEVRGL